MAVGDVITGVGAAATQTDFQPAVGVNIMIIVFAFNGNSRLPRYTDGVTYTLVSSGLNGESLINSGKMLVTNALYFSGSPLPAGESIAYSGIQIA